MPKIRAKRSAIWQHFVTEYQENGSKTIVKCNRCNLIVPCCKNTTNLWSHVRTHHRNVLEKNSPDVSNKKANEARAIASNSSEFEREPITFSSSKAHEITRSLVKMIAEDVLPFSIVNGNGFASFVGKLNGKYKIPKRNTLIAKFLPELYEGERRQLNESLSRAACVHVAISLRPSIVHAGLILATSVHFSVDGVQHHKLLRISFRPTDYTVPISSELGEIAETWRFYSKVNVVTVDNTFNDRVHGLHNTCFAHTLNHIAQSAVRETKIVLDLVEKCRDVVRDSKIQNAVAKSQGSAASSSKRLSLLKDTDDRWVSTYSMLNRMHELKPILSKVLADMPPSLSENEWNVISEVIRVLMPLHAATKELLCDCYVTISKIIPVVHGIEAVLRNTHDLSIAATLFRDNLLSRFDERFDNVEEIVHYAVATFLDPRYKDVAFRSENCVQKVKDLLMKKLNVFDDTNTGTCDARAIRSTKTKDENMETSVLWAVFDKRVQELAVEFDDNFVVNCLSRQELDRYVNLKVIGRKDNPITWWNTTGRTMFPNLSKIAADYLCIPVYSVLNNPLFSKLHKILFDRRVRLSDEQTNMLAVI
ncbi:unnamed protein product, partial [Heterotrigona itama]